MIINFLAARHAPQWDLSETQNFTLTRQTYQVLRELKREVTIKVFAHERSPLFGAFRDLFNTYTNETPKLTVEFIDPEKQPEVARTYGISRIDTAVFESGTQKIYLNEASEKEITNALLRVTQDNKKAIGISHRSWRKKFARSTTSWLLSSERGVESNKGMMWKRPSFWTNQHLQRTPRSWCWPLLNNH